MGVEEAYFLGLPFLTKLETIENKCAEFILEQKTLDHWISCERIKRRVSLLKVYLSYSPVVGGCDEKLMGTNYWTLIPLVGSTFVVSELIYRLFQKCWHLCVTSSAEHSSRQEQKIAKLESLTEPETIFFSELGSNERSVDRVHQMIGSARVSILAAIYHCSENSSLVQLLCDKCAAGLLVHVVIGDRRLEPQFNALCPGIRLYIFIFCVHNLHPP